MCYDHVYVRRGALMKEDKAMTIRVVVFREEELWVAHCVEYDIATQARSMPELRSRLEATLSAELAHSVKQGAEAFAGIPAAPAYIEEMWQRCEQEKLAPTKA